VPRALSTKEDFIKEIQRRRHVIREYFENYYKHLEVRDYVKASEDLWGIVNNLASILSLLLRGKPIGKHSELRELIDHLITMKQNPELKELLLACETLHANFFHNFMDEEQFKEHREKAEKLIRFLETYISDELSKIGLYMLAD